MASIRRPRQARALAQVFAVGLIFLNALSVNAQKITQGPLAPVTIGTERGYSTARACAAKCLLYQGDLPCGLAGYYDLAINLGCSCYSKNGCFCNTALKTSATSYMASCVSANCVKSVSDWTVDLSSMLGLYDNYCKTAMVDGTSVSFVPSTMTTTGGSATTAANPAATGSGTLASRTGSASPGSTSGSASGSDSSGGDKLSGTAILALAIGVGVGVPLIISIAVVACCCVWLKKRKDKKKAAQNQPNMSATSQAIPLLETPTGTTITTAASPKTGNVTPVGGWAPADGRHELDPRRQYDGTNAGMGGSTGANIPASTTWTQSPGPAQHRHEVQNHERFEAPGQPSSRHELS